jgi:hypothetical protein
MANIFKHVFPNFFNKKINPLSFKRYHGGDDIDALFNTGLGNLQQLMSIKGCEREYYDSISDIDNAFTALRMSGKKDLDIISVLNSHIIEFDTNNLSNEQFKHFKSIYSNILNKLK